MFSGKCSQEKLFEWNRKLKWSEIQKSVYQDNSVHGNHLFLCLNELAQGTLAKLCLFKAIPVGQHPEGCLKGSVGCKGLQRLTLAFRAFGVCPWVPPKGRSFSELSRQARFRERRWKLRVWVWSAHHTLAHWDIKVNCGCASSDFLCS